MTAQKFPELDIESSRATRAALQAYARVLGAWLKAVRPHRKHWWHASLRSSLTGLSTGVVHAGVDFELNLNLLASELVVHTAERDFCETLTGQSAASLASWLDGVLTEIGVDASLAPAEDVRSNDTYPDYSTAVAASLQRAFASVAAALSGFRAGIREETSPIQVWPHHFDMSMIWLPGAKVAGEDPANEEYADRQMNFGFSFGDEGIDEPYFYVTAYPTPASFPQLELPDGTNWQSDGFNGAVLLYNDLIALNDPAQYLQALWSALLSAGRTEMTDQ